MPITRRQANRILDVNGKPFIAPGRLDNNLSARVCESWVRRRLFRHEDRTVMTLHGLYKQTFSGLQAAASGAAAQHGIDKLAADGASMDWRRSFIRQAVPRLQALTEQVALDTYGAAQAAYLGGYYGRAWLLDSMTRPDVRINMARLDTGTVKQRVLQAPLLEQTQPDMLWDLLGTEWRESFSNELDLLIVKMRRSLNASMAEGVGIPQAMRNLADVMGVNISKSGGYAANFAKVQTITRSYIIDAANRGAMDLYAANADLLAGVEWLASNDGRACSTCLSLDGTVWPVGEQLMPVRDSHYNCRCSLIPRLASDDLSAPPDTLPDNSFYDFIEGFGLGLLLYDFLGDDRTLDSERIGDLDEIEYA